MPGSVGGPLLFLLYVDDLISIFDDKSCVCKLYVDDVKPYTVLQTNADYYSLQSKLNELFAWSERWQLTISYNKCSNSYVGNADC
jgi:Reverse transcriptase (RNA-dependent DNA polymerase)